MAEVKTSPQAPGPGEKTPAAKRGPSIHQVYALPAPIRTFPLPNFYPGNPLSLVHVASAWLGQVLSPPPAEPAVVHHGTWSEATTSVHVTDEKSMRALWEQGFYGKGSLSRSEPNWLKRERVRRGLQDAHVSELLTVQRRQERAQAKWERARLEQEAIQKTRLEEARQAQPVTPRPPPAGPAPPVGPQQILALPNSDAELLAMPCYAGANGRPTVHHGHSADYVAQEPSPTRGLANGSAQSSAPEPPLRGNEQNGTAIKRTDSAGSGSKSHGRQKSVRFSPKVDSATFQLSDPPSPGQSLTSGRGSQQFPGHDGGTSVSSDATAMVPAAGAVGSPSAPEAQDIVNLEHLQLTPEEAFFLCFGLGALRVSDGGSGLPLSTRSMLTRFRQYSFFPPRVGPEEPDLGPDDGFLLHYAVYHHFRSLGWVPRAGIKFGVDWLLYTRGPVFDHAEFGIMVVPSYSDAWWKGCGKRGPRKTWDWLHNSVRVLSHVMKSLVLVYVDVPTPARFEAALEAGITEALKLYRIREVMVKRWSSNRNR